MKFAVKAGKLFRMQEVLQKKSQSREKKVIGILAEACPKCKKKEYLSKENQLWL
jgi:hypothetical protein